MNRYFLLLLSCFLSHMIYSQGRVIEVVVIGEWNGTHVTMEDFNKIPKRFKLKPEAIRVDYVDNLKFLKENGLTYKYPTSRAILYLNLYENWEEVENWDEERFLGFANLLFDLGEVYSEKLNQLIHNYEMYDDINEEGRKLRAEFNDFMGKVKLETDLGNDPEKLAFWRDYISQELRQIKSLYSSSDFPLPNFQFSRIESKATLGLGSIYTGNGLTEFIDPSFLGLSTSLALGFHRSEVNFSINMNSGTILQSHGSKNEWKEGERTVLYVSDLTYGYKIFRSEKFNIIPVIGLSFMSLENTISDQEIEDDSYEKLRYRSTLPVVGIHFDYYLNRSISVNYNEFREKPFNEKTKTGGIFIRMKTIYGNFNFNPVMNGSYHGIILSLGYDF
jgi:hypothetical protein